MTTFYAGAEWMTLPLLTNEIRFHLVNVGPIRMKLFGIFSETHNMELVQMGGKLYLYLHQSIFRP